MKLYEFKATAIVEGEGHVWAQDEDEARAMIMCQHYGQFLPTDTHVSRVDTIKEIDTGIVKKKAQRKA